LRARERIPEVRPENTRFDSRFEIPTLEKVIGLVTRMQSITGRKVGIYPETKHPPFLKRFEHLQVMFAGIEKAFTAVPSSAHATDLELKLAHAARIAGVKHVLKLSGDLSGTDLHARTAREPAGLSCTILATSRTSLKGYKTRKAWRGYHEGLQQVQ
jgi:hypothetical protein